jgi:hypothetical protein
MFATCTVNVHLKHEMPLLKCAFACATSKVDEPGQAMAVFEALESESRTAPFGRYARISLVDLLACERVRGGGPDGPEADPDVAGNAGGGTE